MRCCPSYRHEHDASLLTCHRAILPMFVGRQPCKSCANRGHRSGSANPHFFLRSTSGAETLLPPVIGRASGTLEDADAVSATATVTRAAQFPVEELLGIAGDLRSIVPLLRQLVEAQAKLGDNVAASVVLIRPDAARIAELTAATLDDEARSDQPRMHVVEQCLRVGEWLLQTAMKVMASVILAIDGNLSYEALTDPDQAQRHVQHIVIAIEHILPRLFGQ